MKGRGKVQRQVLWVLWVLLLGLLREAGALSAGSGHRPSSSLKLYAAPDKVTQSLPPPLTSRLQQYIAVRDAALGNLSTSSTPIYAYYTNRLLAGRKTSQDMGETIVEMFKPTGWFKDEEALALQTMLDKSTPIAPHPFSYVELKKYGFEDISAEIIEQGGPQVVADLIGYNWVEPEIIMVADENLRPRTEESFALDMRGSLRLGQALDEQLAAAEALRLDAIKKQLAMKREEEAFDAILDETEDFDGADLDYQNRFKKSGKRKRASWKEVNSKNPQTVIDRRNKFALTALERVHLCATTLSLSLAWGRASHDLINAHILGSIAENSVDTLQTISLVLVALSILSAVYTATQASKKELSLPTWTIRALLGGPSTVFKM